MAHGVHGIRQRMTWLPRDVYSTYWFIDCWH